MKKKKKSWYVYVIRCSDGSLYAGITTDIRRRIHEHNSTKKAARYTRARRPVYLVYHHKCLDRAEAMVSETGFKRFTKERKEQFILERAENLNGV
jgi:putative endonuclease